jgi:hypothetical protein
VLEDAERLIAVWNERQIKRMPMLFSPTIGAIDLRTLDRHPDATVGRTRHLPSWCSSREQAYGAWWTARRIYMNRLLIVAILVISTSPLYAQRQQQNVAKLKADARNLVGIIGSDKTKTQTYCQIHDLSEQLIQAVQEKDRKKANALAEKIAELYKKMGPEFAALIDIEKRVDLNSRDGKEIASIVATLGESCGGQ